MVSKVKNVECVLKSFRVIHFYFIRQHRNGLARTEYARGCGATGTSCIEKYGSTGTSVHHWQEQISPTSLDSNVCFLVKLKLCLSHDPAVSLLHIYLSAVVPKPGPQTHSEVTQLYLTLGATSSRSFMVSQLDFAAFFSVIPHLRGARFWRVAEIKSSA